MYFSIRAGNEQELRAMCGDCRRWKPNQCLLTGNPLFGTVWTGLHNTKEETLFEDISVYFLSVDLRFCLNHVPNQYLKILLLSVIPLSAEGHRMLPSVGGIQD